MVAMIFYITMKCTMRLNTSVYWNMLDLTLNEQYIRIKSEDSTQHSGD